jgi:hypothetical protein
MGELRLDVNKIGSSGARHADVASFAGPERYRDGPVYPMLVQFGDLGLEIGLSGNGRIEGVR